jgi:hypothetical protein
MCRRYFAGSSTCSKKTEGKTLPISRYNKHIAIRYSYGLTLSVGSSLRLIVYMLKQTGQTTNEVATPTGAGDTSQVDQPAPKKTEGSRMVWTND